MVERKGSCGFLTLSVAATISVAVWARAVPLMINSAPNASSRMLAAFMGLHMAQGIHDGQASGAVGRNERSHGRHQYQPHPHADQQTGTAGHGEMQGNRVSVSWRGPGDS